MSKIEKTRITKAVNAKAAELLRNQPGMTFRDLVQLEDEDETGFMGRVAGVIRAKVEQANQAYAALAREIIAIEDDMRLHLFDEGMDAQNVEPLDGRCIGYWPAMIRSSSVTIGALSESARFDINARLGRIIY